LIVEYNKQISYLDVGVLKDTVFKCCNFLFEILKHPRSSMLTGVMLLGMAWKLDARHIQMHTSEIIIVLMNDGLDDRLEKFENDFCMVISRLARKQQRKYESVNWDQIYKKVNSKSTRLYRVDYSSIFDSFKINSVEDLRNVYVFLKIEEFCDANNIVIGDIDETVKTELFKKFVDDKSHFFVDDLDLESFGVSIGDRDDVEMIWRVFDYQRKIAELPREISRWQHLGLLVHSILGNELWWKSDIHAVFYDNDQYFDALWKALNFDTYWKTYFEKNNIVSRNHFRRMVLAPTQTDQNEIMKHIVSSYDWNEFDNVFESWETDKIMVQYMDDNMKFEMYEKLMFCKNKYQLEHGFSLNEKKNALNKFLHIKNISDTEVLSLARVREAFAQILYWERVFDNLWIAEDLRPSLALVYLREDMDNDGAKAVNKYSNIVYFPNVNLLYQVSLAEYLGKQNIWDRAADMKTFGAVTTEETTMRSLTGDDGASKGMWQLYKPTAYYILTNDFNHDLYRSYIQSNIEEKPSMHNLQYDFYSQEDMVRWFMDFVVLNKRYNSELSDNNKAFTRFNGDVSNIDLDGLSPKLRSIYEKKLWYGQRVASKEANFGKFMDDCIQLDQKYLELLKKYEDKSVILPGVYPELWTGSMTFLYNTLANKEESQNLSTTMANQYLGEYIKILLNPEIEVFNRGNELRQQCRKDIDQQQNLDAFTKDDFMEKGWYHIEKDPWSHHTQQNISDYEIDGDIYINVIDGNTFFSYLRWNLDEGIAYHNSLWRDWVPFYELVSVWTKTWVKVFDAPPRLRDVNDQWVWSQDYLIENGSLQLYLDPKISINYYNFSVYGSFGVPIFFDCQKEFKSE